MHNYKEEKIRTLRKINHVTRDDELLIERFIMDHQHLLVELSVE